MTTTGGGTCTTGGGTCTTGAGAGTVSTSFVLEKHPERSPPMASDTIIEQNPTRDRIIFSSTDVNEGSSSNRAIALIGPIGPIGFDDLGPCNNSNKRSGMFANPCVIRPGVEERP